MDFWFNSVFFQITKGCTLSCLQCPISVSGSRGSSLDVFLNKELVGLSSCRHFHLFGGDPLSEPEILRTLVSLNEAQKKVGLWTPLGATLDVLGQVAPFIYRWYVYFPTSIAEEYLFETGTHAWEEFTEKLSFLGSEHQRVTLVSFIDEKNLEQLPQVYEFAYYKKLPLLILFDPKRFKHKSHCRYVTYFRQKKNVTVLRVTMATQACLGVPFNIPMKWVQYIQNAVSPYLL